MRILPISNTTNFSGGNTIKPKTVIGKSGLPLEEPIERTYRLVSSNEIIDRMKNKIQISIENMQAQVDKNGKHIK